MPISPHDTESGFTLAEMLAVLAIMALAAGLVVGRGLPGGHIVQLAALEGYVRDARSAAMVQGHVVVVSVDPAASQLRAEPDLAPLDLGVGAQVQSHSAGGDGRFVFFPDGSAIGGALRVVPARGKAFGIVIAPLTGAVTALR